MKNCVVPKIMKMKEQRGEESWFLSRSIPSTIPLSGSQLPTPMPSHFRKTYQIPQFPHEMEPDSTINLNKRTMAPVDRQWHSVDSHQWKRKTHVDSHGQCRLVVVCHQWKRKKSVDSHGRCWLVEEKLCCCCCCSKIMIKQRGEWVFSTPMPSVRVGTNSRAE